MPDEGSPQGMKVHGLEGRRRLLVLVREGRQRRDRCDSAEGYRHKGYCVTMAETLALNLFSTTNSGHGLDRPQGSARDWMTSGKRAGISPARCKRADVVSSRRPS